MGVSASTELPAHFDSIRTWPWTRAASVIRTYSDGEYDFGIDENVVVSITGCDGEEARQLIIAHSRNDSGIVNAMTLLITIVVLADSSKRNENIRLHAVFDLLDFAKTNLMSFDELTILLLCVCQSFSFILSKHFPFTDSHATKWASAIYERLGKRSNNSITKEELQSWATIQLWKNNIFTVNAILDVLKLDPAELSSSAEEEKK